MTSVTDYILHDVSVAVGDVKHCVARQRDTEAQTFAEIRGRYATGNLSDDDMVDLYERYKLVTGPGHRTRWDAGIGDLFSSGDVQYHRQYGTRHRPNMPNGGYSGAWPIDINAPRPGKRQPVVYTLFDTYGEVCYIGSTQNLANRLRSHVHDGKAFVRWVAVPCADRESAYLMEEALLADHVQRTGRLPYLNRRAGR